jgi:hypothetical protein
MTRIGDGAPPPFSIPNPDTDPAAVSEPKVTATVPSELYRVLEAAFAPQPDQAFDLERLSKVVIDWWVNGNVPSNFAEKSVRQQLSEQLSSALRDDPVFQSMLTKLASPVGK